MFCNQWLTRCDQKISFYFKVFFAYEVLLKVYLHRFSKINIQKNSQNNRNRDFSYSFTCWWKDPDPYKQWRIRIRMAKNIRIHNTAWSQGEEGVKGTWASLLFNPFCSKISPVEMFNDDLSPWSSLNNFPIAGRAIPSLSTSGLWAASSQRCSQTGCLHFVFFSDPSLCMQVNLCACNVS